MVTAYREHVDRAMASLMQDDLPPAVAELIELGCHHEQQHQELLLTDILHLFAQNPLRPAYKDPARSRSAKPTARPLPIGRSMAASSRSDTTARASPSIARDRGIACLSNRFNWRIGSSPTRNGSSSSPTAAIATPLLWLSEGWATVQSEGWTAPLYWEERDGGYWTMTLRGAQPVDPAAPVTHVSYFEADAFATWAGRRLPTEFEWEHAAVGEPLRGNFVELRTIAPGACASRTAGLRQMYGDVWEWTRSAFSPYPRFKPAEGAVGEYNGKFMCGQFVLRGGSCVTPTSHMRPTYRNFFPPDARWQFSGLRLAEDA